MNVTFINELVFRTLYIPLNGKFTISAFYHTSSSCMESRPLMKLFLFKETGIMATLALSLHVWSRLDCLVDVSRFALRDLWKRRFAGGDVWKHNWICRLVVSINCHSGLAWFLYALQLFKLLNLELLQSFNSIVFPLRHMFNFALIIGNLIVKLKISSEHFLLRWEVFKKWVFL